MTTLTYNSSSALHKTVLSNSIFESSLSFLWNIRHPLSRFTEPLLSVPERITYQTSDNWRVTMDCFPHKKGRGEPLLLSTGPLLHCNVLRLGESTLLKALQMQGFDVFLFSHRGQRNAHYLNKHKAPIIDWNDIVSKDMAAAIDAVKKYSGAQKVFWMGHGLGGLMLYSWLSIGGERDLAGACTIDAPALYVPQKIPVTIKILSKFLSRLPHYPTKNIAQLYAQSAPELHPNLSPERSRGILHHCLENISPLLVEHIVHWIETGRFCLDNKHYLSTLRHCKIPLLLLAGQQDEFAEYVSSTTKHFSTARFHHGNWTHMPFWEEAQHIYTPLSSWIQPHRDACWTE